MLPAKVVLACGARCNSTLYAGAGYTMLFLQWLSWQLYQDGCNDCWKFLDILGCMCIPSAVKACQLVSMLMDTNCWY